MVFSNLYLNENLVKLINWVSFGVLEVCSCGYLVDVIIFITVVVTSLIGILYMLPTGREIIKRGVGGIAFGVGVQIGKEGYNRFTGGGSGSENNDNNDKKDDDKKDDKKDEDTKDAEKKRKWWK